MSETFGPFGVRPGVLERSSHLVDLLVRNRPGTTGYRLWVSKTLADAYGSLVGSGFAGSGGTNLLTVASNGLGQTLALIRRGWRVEEVRRGQTSFQMDPEDAGIADEMFFYARLQEQRSGTWLAVPGGAINNAGVPIRGPILVVFPASHHAASASVMSLQSVAPLLTGCAAASPPVVDQTVQDPLPLHLVLPKPANTVSITNLTAGDTLLVSYGLGMPMLSVGPGKSSIPTGGGYSQPGVREIVIASAAGAGAAVPFSIELSVGNELA